MRPSGFAAALLAFLLTVTGCSGSSTRTEKTATCDELVDVAVQAVVDARDAAIGTTFQTFDLVKDEAKPILADLREANEAVEARASELGCGEDALEAYHDAVLDIAPRSEGAIRLMEYVLAIPPFQPSPG